MRLAEHTGCVGRPVLSGSRDGRAWSTKIRVRAVTLSGRPVGSFAAGGPGRLDVEANDPEAQLGRTLGIELLPSGLLRCCAPGDQPGPRR